MTTKKDAKEEILEHIGLSKKNRDFYAELYKDGNLMNKPKGKEE